MTDQKAKSKGRPKTAHKMNKQLNVRVDDELFEAVEKYRGKYARQLNLREVSDAVRHALTKVMLDEGLLK